MKNTRIVNPRKIVQYLLENIQFSIVTRLLDFCKKRIVEVGLTTPSLAGGYTLSGPSVETRKNIGRLKTLIYKYLVKRIPYLALTQGEFLQIVNRDQVQIVLQSPVLTSDFSNIDWELISSSKTISNYSLYMSDSRIKKLAAQELSEHKWAKRYARYLNYIFRKYCVPLSVDHNCSIIFNESLAAEAVNKPSSFLIPFYILTTFNFSFVRWRAINNDIHERIRNEHNQNDSYFADINNWVAEFLIGSRVEDNSESYRFSIEKIFLHLDTIVKSLANISRKAYYETSAYSFRNQDDS